MAPTIGLVQHIVNSLGAARLWDGRPAIDTLARVLRPLDEHSAARLGETLGEVLPLLRDEPDRLRVGLDVVRLADLFEAWPGLASMIRNGHASGDVLTTAASIAVHPGVPPLLSELLEMAVVETDLPDWQRRLVSLRLDPDGVPNKEIERVSAGEQWPSAGNWNAGDAPLVAIHPSAGKPSQCLQLAWELSDLGCIVRRLPAALSAEWTVDPRWLASWTPVVAASASAATSVLQALNHGVILDTEGALGVRERRAVLRRIEAVLPPGSALMRPPVEMHEGIRGAPTAEMSPAFMSGGAHTRAEVAFLSGTRRKELTSFARLDELQPRSIRGINYWTFSQLVAVRTWRFFKASSPGPVGRAVASKLVRLTQSESATLVGVTQRGRVLAYDGDGDLVDVETGQTASDEVLTFADRLFRPFPLGGGRLAPDLLRPSVHTRVNPLVAGGTPVVDGSRIPAYAVHQMLTDARQSRASAESVATVIAEYPELTAASVQDADRLARSVLAVL